MNFLSSGNILFCFFVFQSKESDICLKYDPQPKHGTALLEDIYRWAHTVKATVTRDWAGVKVVSKDMSEVVDIAGAHF